MINAKQELEEALAALAKTHGCASVIQYAEVWTINNSGKPIHEVTLYKGYTPEEFNAFWDWFDFEYDDGFGTQVLCGYVVLDKGRWVERREYDGSEWWEYVKKPKAPKRPKGEK